jgi:hypothetical protein
MYLIENYKVPEGAHGDLVSRLYKLYQVPSNHVFATEVDLRYSARSLN